MNPTIEVVIELEGEPLVVGTLWTRRKQGREDASFAYSECVIQEVVAALEGWVAVAKACGLNSSQIERMSSAFEHPERML